MLTFSSCMCIVLLFLGGFFTGIVVVATIAIVVTYCDNREERKYLKKENEELQKIVNEKQKNPCGFRIKKDEES